MTRSLDTRDLVETVVERMAEHYVFADRSTEAAALLRTRLDEDAYGLSPNAEVCAAISADLFAATHDQHLRLIWHEVAEASEDEAQLVAALRETIRSENQGVRRVERLPGNIALLELTILPEAASGGDTLNAAMTLVQHTHALIIDLRSTRGGSPEGVVLLASYLFRDGETRLSDFVEGPVGPPRQYWTAAYLPGPRYLDRPVYLLTSEQTFSGGEALAYDLQALGRATVIGETTRGGAHPSEVVSLTHHIELRLPVARSINPITGENWEGVGVQPDTPATADAAFEVARMRALEEIVRNARVTEASRAEAKSALSGTASPLRCDSTRE